MIDAKTYRECHFYSNFLYEEFSKFHLGSIDRLASTSKYSRAINTELQYLVKEQNKREKLIKKMKYEFERQELGEEDFQCLKPLGERFCNWAWYFLRLKSNKNRRQETQLVPIESLGKINYDDIYVYSFRSTSNNYQDRMSDIIQCFHQSELSVKKQKALIEELLQSWEVIFVDTKIVDWLEKNNISQYKWALKYINDFDSRLLEKTWSPTSNDEMKHAIINLFDQLHDSPDRRALLIGNMKRAWSQKKFRDTNKGKKAYSISMTTTTKQRLDDLAKHKGLKINETIELLIRQEYDILND